MSGWTVAETAVLPTKRQTSATPPPPTHELGKNTTCVDDASIAGQSPRGISGGKISRQHSNNSQQHHVRFSDNNSVEGEKQVDLDELLDGLDKLTETLPDLLNNGFGETRGNFTTKKNYNPSASNTSTLRGTSPSPPPRPPPPESGHFGQNQSVQNTDDNNFGQIQSVRNTGYNTLPANFGSRPTLSSPRSPLSRQKRFDEPDLTESSYPSVKKTRELLQSRDTYAVDDSSQCSDDYNNSRSVSGGLRQPYHTLQNSKPFSYIRSNQNTGSMPSSRNLSRTSSREALNSSQPGLESPGLLRKIMGMPEPESRPDSPPKVKPMSIKSNKSNGVTEIPIQFESSPSQFYASSKSTSAISNGNKPGFQSKVTTNFDTVSDEDSSLSWLARQQRKLLERREKERRRFFGGPSAKPPVSSNDPLYQTRSETTTDGYASDLASMLYSETSTRESSPHKYQLPNQSSYLSTQQQPIYNNNKPFYQHSPQVYNIPVHVESTPYHSTPKYPPPPSSDYGYGRTRSLSRQKSDTSFDRSRPSFINRRLRYDSESESELTSDLFRTHHNGLYGSNTSIDSSLHWGTLGSQSGSRPTTPAFPSTPNFNDTRMRLAQRSGSSLRAPSPAGSLYQQATSEYNSSSRRGSVSSEPADVSPMHVKLVKDNHKFWYKPNISRDEAISMLKHRSPGTFVVRDSNSFPGAYGLALKVATPPPNVQNKSGENELIRHFLIEPTSKGVKLKGYHNEPVFGSLSALVYQHTITQLALPTRLVMPQADLVESGSGRRDSVDSRASTNSQMQQLLSMGAACNVMYLLTMEMDSLTGPAAVKKTVGQLFRGSHNAASPLLVHFKVSGKGITLTDQARKRFFRKHFNTNSITYCGIDPDDRRFSESPNDRQQKIFGFVARKPTSRSQNQCHIFAEHDPEQPARAIVNFVNKVMLSSNHPRADVV